MSTPTPVTLQLPVHLVEEGRMHPFVQVVIQQLKIMHQDAINKTVGYSLNSGDPGGSFMIRTHAGMSAAYAAALRLLENSIGKDEDEHVSDRRSEW